MQVTCKFKSAKKKKKKDLYRKQYNPKRFNLFSPKKIRMTTKPLKIAAKIIFMSRQINLNTRNLKVITYNQEKCKLNMTCYFCSSVYVYVERNQRFIL